MRLLESEQPEVASTAALFIAKRLPVPNGKEPPLRTLNGFITPGGEMELYAHRYWLPELDAMVIKAARKMVTRSEADEVGRAAALLGGLGEVTDAELVFQALDRVVRTTKDRTDPKARPFSRLPQGPPCSARWKTSSAAAGSSTSLKTMKLAQRGGCGLASGLWQALSALPSPRLGSRFSHQAGVSLCRRAGGRAASPARPCI
ncbi:hypothetical protein [Verrucomicrobium spinosum]|uniref:hypothetical protein n=1 Tax=Verrucomicrobium spinosum TaxID=2736 RepID=UPI0009464C06|nr:hypothetical protein [Verrucomicrobium spinosum]